MTTRTWQDTKRDIEVTTKYGPARLVVTDAKHVHFDAGTVTIHGVERNLAAHVHLWDDGQWRVGPETVPSEPTRLYGHLYMNRADGRSTVPTYRMRVTIAEEIVRVITEFAAAHPEVFTSGERTSINNRIVRIQQELAKAEALVDSLRAQLTEAYREEEEAL